MDELYQNLVRLSPKEQVPFRCIGCGACCKHVHMQVPVETLDAFRIVMHLQQQGEDIECMDDFWERYTEPALLNECGFFVYFLKTQGPEEACIFLQDNRCRIHTVNPRACRICKIGTRFRILSDTTSSKELSKLESSPTGTMERFRRMGFFTAANAPMQPMRP